MILRFQADADLNQIILHAVVRRAPALDFQTAAAAGLAGVRDPEVLALAARDGRVLVTHDQKTMPKHFAAFIATTTSPGVLIIPQRLPIATAVDDLLLIWSTMDAEDEITPQTTYQGRFATHPVLRLSLYKPTSACAVSSCRD
jgi:predicted nuclease of predicted toxin-antitoxin system